MEEVRGLNHKRFSPEELEDLTNNFSEVNLIGETQFGKVYRGMTQQGLNVTVKIWEDVGRYPAGRDAHLSQLKNECIFLTEPSVNQHPNLVKLIGYCCEDSLLGVVYDLKPVNTVRNLIVKDGFSWLHRIKAAIVLARLLEFLHCQTPEYIVRNICPAHIMLDQDCNPVLFDFGMLIGGVFGDKQPIPSNKLHGSLGYFDPTIGCVGRWGIEHDVFSFGTVLLELISKSVYERKTGERPSSTYRLANIEYERKKPKKSFFCFGHSKKPSLVHKRLEEDLGFSHQDGCKITELAISCVQYCSSYERPTAEEVVQILESLDAVGHGDMGVMFLGENNDGALYR